MKRKPYEIEAIEAAKMAFETGHRCCDRRDFSSKKAYDYYLELMELGPSGFYEEFANELEFDKDFIAEYGGETVDCPNCKHLIDLDICETDKYWKEDKKGVEHHLVLYRCPHCGTWINEEDC